MKGNPKSNTTVVSKSLKSVHKAPLTMSQMIARQRVSLASKEGILDLTGVAEDNLQILGQQPHLRKLILTDSAIFSISTLKPQPILKAIIADGSRMNTLEGFGNHPRLQSISLKDTPISKHKHFRLAAMIAVGRNLTQINGEQITPSEVKQWKSYPKIAKQMVNSGWMPIYPPPSHEDFEMLASEFDIHYQPHEKEELFRPLGPTVEIQEQPIESNDDNSQSFNMKCYNLLHDLGYPVRIGTHLDEDILNSVDKICKLVKAIESKQITQVEKEGEGEN